MFTCVGFIVSVVIYGATPGDAATSSAVYMPMDTCKLCHKDPAKGDQWSVWEKSKHAQAYKTLQTSQAQEIATKAGVKTPAAEAPRCLRCHVTAYDEKTGSTPPKVRLEDGVQCQECHGPASLHREDGVAMLFHKKEPANIELSAHILRPDEKTCAACHNPESPTWRPDRYTTAKGEKVGFDYEQAFKQIAHPVPGQSPWIK